MSEREVIELFDARRSLVRRVLAAETRWSTNEVAQGWANTKVQVPEAHSSQQDKRTQRSAQIATRGT
jgi:hypothetical protein